MESAITNMIAVLLTGRPLSNAGMLEAFEMTGAMGLQRDRIGDLGPIVKNFDPDELAKLHERSSLMMLRRAAAETGLATLTATRDFLRKLIEFALEWHRAVSRTTHLADSFGLGPLAALVDDLDWSLSVGTLQLASLTGLADPQNVHTLLDAAERETARYRAINKMLDGVPKRYHRYLGPDGAGLLERLSVDRRSELTTVVSNYLKAHPEDAKLLLNQTQPSC